MNGEWGAAARRAWFQHWWLPFLWILLVPIMTGPSTWMLNQGACVQSELLQAEGFWGPRWAFRCDVPHLLIALAPGALNLLPAIWLLSSQSRTRAAAMLATAMGAIRLVVPAAVYVQRWPSFDRGDFLSYPPGNLGVISFLLAHPLLEPTWLVSFVLWLGSGLAIPLFAWWTSLDTRRVAGAFREALAFRVAVDAAEWKELTSRPSLRRALTGWPGPFLIVLVLPFVVGPLPFFGAAVAEEIIIGSATLASPSYEEPPTVQVRSVWRHPALIACEGVPTYIGLYACPLGQVAVLIPASAFLYLAPALWLLSRDRLVRRAAFCAGALGFLQLLNQAVLTPLPVIGVFCGVGCSPPQVLWDELAWNGSVAIWTFTLSAMGAFYTVFLRQRRQHIEDYVAEKEAQSRL